MTLEIPRDQRQAFALQTHKEYVDLMWSRFGLPSSPGYARVEIKPLLMSAGGVSYDPDVISVSDVINTEQEIEDTVRHESGHMLHPFARKEYSEGRTPNKDLCEVVAHLGHIVYVALTSREESIQELIEREGTSYSYVHLLLARDIHQKDPDLLAKMCQEDMPEVLELVVSQFWRPFMGPKAPTE